jgi:phage terminase large subunit-like protein
LKIMVDMARAERVIDFLETLRLPDGTNAGKPFILRPWMKDIIYEVYGPVRQVGNRWVRLVREALLSLGRKNAKTTLVAGLCLCHLCGPEAVKNGQLYSLSIDREQAGILFNYAAAMVYADEELSERLNVTESRKKIIDPVSGSVYTVLSGEKKGKMGKSSSFIAFDELAEFGADRALYDALVTSTGAHESPLIWDFSTQSPDDKALFSQLVDYGKKVNAGEINDPTFKSFIYEVPQELDAWDEENWYLANPALGDFRSLEEMRLMAEKAKIMPSAEASFRNLYLNQRIDSSNPFITPTAWKACSDSPDSEIFHRVPVYAGLDLSSKNDLTALVLVAGDENGIFHVKPFFWTPKDALSEREKRDRAPYLMWVDQGFLNAVPGRVIEYRYVAQMIGELHAEYGLMAVKFDRWKIEYMGIAMREEGIEYYVYGHGEGCDWHEDSGKPEPEGIRFVPHGQGFKDMDPAVEVIEDQVVQKKLHHGGHPVLTMCVSNARIQSNPAGGRKFDKIKSTGRIDGLVALAMALNGAVSAVPPQDTDSLVGFEVW